MRHNGFLKVSTLAVVAMATVVLASSPALAATLLGFYPLDGDGIDPTGTGPTLTPVGAITYVPGLDGQAASFSGGPYLDAAINASGDVNPTFSWGGWVKLNNPADWNIFLSNDNGGWDRFSQANGGKWAVSSGGVKQSPHSTSANWTFIAHTFDGTNQHLYVDDLPVFSQPDAVGSAHPFIHIGRNANGAYPLNGLMDGVFFVDDTLTQAEVNTIRNGGPDGTGVLSVAAPPPSPDPIQAGDVIAVDFASAGGSAPNYNVIYSNSTISAGNVVRLSDGLRVADVSLTFSGGAGFNNDGNANAWAGTAADPFYVGTADDITYGGTLTLSVAGLDDSLTYNVRLYSLIGNNPTAMEIFTVTDGAGTVGITDSTRGSRWNAATLGLGGTVFNGVSTDGAGNIVIQAIPVNSNAFLNAVTLEAVTFAAVPEPSSFTLAALGLLGLVGWYGRRRRAV